MKNLPRNDLPRFQLATCERQNRWTRLLRRSWNPGDSFEIVQIPGTAFLDDWLKRNRGGLVAVELDDQDVESVLQRIQRYANDGKKHRFIGLCPNRRRSDEFVLRCSGLDACYFSLTDVQSLIRLARRHFAALKIQEEHEPVEKNMNLTEGFTDRIPFFGRHPVY